MQWGMVIDLKRCIGCMTCVTTCKLENRIPMGIIWNNVFDIEYGEYPDVIRRFQPSICNHCKEPVCLEVCPTGATIKREDGIVYIDYDLCVGCGACILACPYRVRTRYEKEVFPYGEPTLRDKHPDETLANYQKFKVGTTSKCTFCMDRIDEGMSKGLKPGVDPDATPMCVINCPTAARTFGDIDDPGSEISVLKRKRRGYRQLEELGTEPSVYYLGR